MCRLCIGHTLAPFVQPQGEEQAGAHVWSVESTDLSSLALTLSARLRPGRKPATWPGEPAVRPPRLSGSCPESPCQLLRALRCASSRHQQPGQITGLLVTQDLGYLLLPFLHRCHLPSTSSGHRLGGQCALTVSRFVEGAASWPPATPS